MWRETYPGPADILKISQEKGASPRTVSVCTNFGDDTIKLIKMLKELKFCTTKLERIHAKNKRLPFSASHSLTSTYFGSTTIVLIDPLTSCEFIYGSQRNSGLSDLSTGCRWVPLMMLLTPIAHGIGRICRRGWGRGRSSRTT